MIAMYAEFRGDLPVEVSTPWCVAMVVVTKDFGSVRICIDLKLFNERILWEIHHMPKVDMTLVLLLGATVFNKLDANSGFWQIHLLRNPGY